MLKNVKYFKNIWISQLSILKRFKAVLLKIGKLSTPTKKVPQNALFYVILPFLCFTRYPTLLPVILSTYLQK